MKMDNIKVLLVDDDHNVLITLKAMLVDLGITRIFEAKDGKEALDFIDTGARSVSLDLILCDWNMPKKTGFEFLREIRQTYPHIPFLMVTARADESSVQDAVDAGVSAYLRKPFSLDELNKKIVTALGAYV